MRIAIAGGTGFVGRHVVEALREGGHHAVVIARSHGVDLLGDTDDLAAAIDGVESVIDVTNTPTTDPERAQEFFAAVTRRLTAAGRAGGVRHHVVLSLLGIDRVEGNGHYAGKRVQEECARESEVPTTVVRAAPFFEFAEMVMGWTRRGDSATLPPLLIQPLAVGDLAVLLAELAAGTPDDSTVDVAGPEPHDLVDMARRTLTARGEELRLVPSWRGPFGSDMAGEVLLPTAATRLTTTTFDEWLTDLANSTPRRSEAGAVNPTGR